MSKIQGEFKKLKELFLLGPDMTLDIETENILKTNPDVLIIGDGENPIDPEDIKHQLKNKNFKIDLNTRIDISAHGEREEDKQHSIDLFENMDLTKDIFITLKEIAGDNIPLYVHLWSCYGGSANKLVGDLGNGSILVTHIEAKESSAFTLGEFIMNDSLQRFLDPRNNDLTPYQQFILDLPKNYEAATFNQATLDGPKKFKFTRIPKEKYMVDILKQLDSHDTLQEFVSNFFVKEGTRFQKDFPNANLQDAIKQVSHLNEEEAKEYAQGILVHTFATENQNRSKPSIRQFLEKLQNKGVDINGTPDKNANALYRSISIGDKDKVEMLLELGADPNTPDNQSGLVPLHYAALNNNVDAIAILLQYGVDPNMRDKEMQTALHYAALNNNIDAIKTLLQDERTESNALDSDGMSPLRYAQDEGHQKAVSMLKAHNSKINVRHDNEQPPFKKAKRQEAAELDEQTVATTSHNTKTHAISKNLDNKAKLLARYTNKHVHDDTNNTNRFKEIKPKPTLRTR